MATVTAPMPPALGLLAAQTTHKRPTNSMNETDSVNNSACHPPIVFTLDLEDDRGAYLSGSRFEANTHCLMDVLEEQNIRGTVFAVGRTADSSPGLLRRIVGLGHELGCHSWDHTPIDRQDRIKFQADTIRAKDRLQQATGTEVTGYRAPLFSLTPSTVWATEELKDIGFVYSSSLLPAPNPVYGFPGALRIPFRWACGLLEFPVPVTRLWFVAIPYLGGIYLRYLPLSLVRLMMRRYGSSLTQWTYVHPDDFDSTARSVRKPDQPLWRFWAQRFNTLGTLNKLVAILEPGQSISLGQLSSDGDFLSRLVPGPLP